MKIIITVATYYPSIDGVQKVTQYQAEGLVRLGNDVTVITSDNHGEYESEEIHNGVKIIRINAYNKFTMHLGAKKEFQRLVLEHSCDADVMMNVCIQSFAADWVLPIIEQISCTKILYLHSMHDFRWNRSDFLSGSLFIKKILKNIKLGIFYKYKWHKIEQFDKVIHLHEKDYDIPYFVNRGYKNNYVIYNAVDDVFFDMEKVNKKNTIINVGTYNARKNQKKCLDIFYKADTFDYKLILVGQPNNKYYQQLCAYKEALDKRYGKKEVDIYCSIPRTETVRLIKESKIYLLTSIWEAFPISLIEALASGSFYISNNVGIVRYIPGGYIGNNEVDLIRKLAEVCESGVDHLIIDGIKYAEQYFKQDKQVKNLYSILENN